jgi:hypothetical protein
MPRQRQNPAGGKGGDPAGGRRQPGTPEEERELEKEELESFRRRQRWFDEVIGGQPDSPSDSPSDESTDRKQNTDKH